MSAPIHNAKDVPLNRSNGTLPDMSTTITEWFRPMSVSLVEKSTVNFELKEAITEFDFLGVWQPFTDEKLEIKDIGQRSWKWFMLHSDLSLQLKNDDAIVYLGAQYRVMAKKDYSEYGYYEYHLIQDYTGVGP